jgi:GTP pyrophosphokinase
MGTDGLHPARLQLLCEDKKGLLAVISNVFSGADSNIIKGKVERVGDQKSILDFTIEVQGRKHLDKVVLALKKIKEVIKVERLRA